MRPLKLIITGFGTYCNRTEINLEQLGTSGLYLIAGDTGAGKTTLFDAITYALYGSVNGKYRDVSMIRSTFATPDIPTEVELTFEYRDKIYKVTRNPEYERKSKRGDSTTKQTADATLELPDGTVVTQQTKVTQAITELLGIDAIQFGKIVMIAQGDFQQLLVQNTEDRQKIFRKIFKTDYYQKLQDKLAEEEHKLKQDCDNLKLQISHFVDDIECADSSTNSIELEKLKNGELQLEPLLEVLQKIIEEDTAQEKELDSTVKKLEKELTGITATLAKNDQREKNLASLKENQELLEELNKEAETAKEEFEEQKKLEGERKKKEDEYAVQNEKLSSYDKLDELDKGITEDTDFCKAKDKELKDLLKRLEDARSKQETMTKEQKELSDCEQKVALLNAQKEKLEERENDIVNLETKIKEYEQAQKDLEASQAEYKTASEKWTILDDKYRHLRKLYMDEQAGILAQELKENTPCPVCGSLEHPHPAEKSQTAPTKEELDEAEAKQEKAKETAETRNAQCVEKKAKCESLQKNIQEEGAQLLDGASQIDEAILAQKKQELLNEISSKAQELQKEEQRVKAKEKIEQELPLLAKTIDQGKDEQLKLENQITAAQTRIKENQKQLEALNKKLEYKTKALAQEALQDLLQQINTMKEAFEKAQKKNEELATKVNTINANIKQLEKLLEESENINKEELEQKQNELTEQKQTVTDKKSQVDRRLNRNTKARENIQKGSGNLATLEKKYQSVSALSKTANGMLTGGKEKIKLETYIQMTYLDRIIAHANKRLMIMSDLQYELVRRKEAADLRSVTGLELDVVDHYNGGQRSVKSLSGGETFQASLSLALGLSDEVRHSAGGIKIDSMFVDEGFGTLDSESLQKAFRALSGITEGNRLVGIISHVDLLKEKIDKQLIVKKEHTGGSTVRLVI